MGKCGRVVKICASYIAGWGGALGFVRSGSSHAHLLTCCELQSGTFSIAILRLVFPESASEGFLLSAPSPGGVDQAPDDAGTGRPHRTKQ